jgi:hypothetical protein
MIVLILAMLLQGPPIPVPAPVAPMDERAIGHMLDLVPIPLCAQEEEIAGFIDLYKTCNGGTFNLMVQSSDADRVQINISYLDAKQKVRHKKIDLVIYLDMKNSLVATNEIQIDPKQVKSIEITMSGRGRKTERQKFVYAKPAPDYVIEGVSP